MNLSICTISFRHQLTSIEQLASWARSNHFQGIELWGAHAKNLCEQTNYNKDWLASYGLRVTMISDYLPLLESDEELFRKIQLLIRLAKHWGTQKIRTFAGNQGSQDITQQEKEQLFYKLNLICQWLQASGLTLIVETHPHTFADTLHSTKELLNAIPAGNLKINFDVLHVWESKADVIDALNQLSPSIDHFHFKNISDESRLNVFSPPNVYSAAGSREGMVPLFEGVIDYKQFLEYIYSPDNPGLAAIDSSLEWFGEHARETLAHDRYLIQKIYQGCKPIESIA